MSKKIFHDQKHETKKSSTADASRRNFLKGSAAVAGIGLAAAAIPGLTAAAANSLLLQEQGAIFPFPANRMGRGTAGDGDGANLRRPWRLSPHMCHFGDTNMGETQTWARHKRGQESG